MKAAGAALLVVGTIVGSLGGARLPEADLTIAGAGIALLVVALVLLRWPRTTTTGGAVGDARALVLLGELPALVEALASDAATLEPSEVRGRLDALQRSHVLPIADGSTALLPALGADRFALVFGAFASAERWLARAWSAAADQHAEETRASLASALERLREAKASLPGG